jgi:hypothetical protein
MSHKYQTHLQVSRHHRPFPPQFSRNCEKMPTRAEDVKGPSRRRITGPYGPHHGPGSPLIGFLLCLFPPSALTGIFSQFRENCGGNGRWCRLTGRWVWYLWDIVDFLGIGGTYLTSVVWPVVLRVVLVFVEK